MGRHPGVEGSGEGMLIAGGWNWRGNKTVRMSAEAYNPHIQKVCKLANLPDGRYGHTLCGGLLCGGGQGTERSCLKFGSSGFVKTTVSLKQKRDRHLCWNVPKGILLLGGKSSPSTTELVLRDGSASVMEFGLTHPAM